MAEVAEGHDGAGRLLRVVAAAAPHVPHSGVIANSSARLSDQRRAGGGHDNARAQRLDLEEAVQRDRDGEPDRAGDQQREQVGHVLVARPEHPWHGDEHDREQQRASDGGEQGRVADRVQGQHAEVSRVPPLTPKCAEHQRVSYQQEHLRARDGDRVDADGGVGGEDAERQQPEPLVDHLDRVGARQLHAVR